MQFSRDAAHVKKHILTDIIMSYILRKPAFCLCENKAVDQLCGNRTADQCLSFRHIDSTIPLLTKSEILSL